MSDTSKKVENEQKWTQNFISEAQKFFSIGLNPTTWVFEMSGRSRRTKLKTFWVHTTFSKKSKGKNLKKKKKNEKKQLPFVPL